LILPLRQPFSSAVYRGERRFQPVTQRNTGGTTGSCTKFADQGDFVHRCWSSAFRLRRLTRVVSAGCHGDVSGIVLNAKLRRLKPASTWNGVAAIGRAVEQSDTAVVNGSKASHADEAARR